MVTLANAFPFHKLKHEKYLMIEVIMYLKHGEASKFMFSLNKESRKFLEDNLRNLMCYQQIRQRQYLH